mmetsp:Transcript_8801/g.20516  ORF Transcript_8801/g.20516 Transcript_8801/m.20516 type:complete len:131 (+) Transcript_8801:206-598(+)
MHVTKDASALAAIINSQTSTPNAANSFPWRDVFPEKDGAACHSSPLCFSLQALPSVTTPKAGCRHVTSECHDNHPTLSARISDVISCRHVSNRQHFQYIADTYHQVESRRVEGKASKTAARDRQRLSLNI